ncbi:MAG: tyrosine-type recombinase/integrase [Planctomycetota bacterium]|jgi:integrase
MVLLERRLKVSQGKYLQSPVKRYTFGELVVEYLDWARVKRTYPTYHSRLKKVAKKFGNMPLESFTLKLLEQYQAELLGDNQPGSVNRTIELVKRAFSKGAQWGMVSEEGVSRLKQVDNLKEPPGRLRFLSGEECETLINACSRNLGPIVIMALNTGMRKGEILKLKWEQVDLRHRFIHLYITKNGKRREIPINDTLKEILEAIPHSRDSEYVFANRNGDPYKEIHRPLATACRHARLTDFRFHDLRHTFASHLVMAG